MNHTAKVDFYYLSKIIISFGFVVILMTRIFAQVLLSVTLSKQKSQGHVATSIAWYWKHKSNS